jgi:hypothetical protein
MKIECKSNQSLSANQQVNRVGKFLYKHIDGAFNYKKSSNMYDVYMTILYQLPVESQDKSKGEEFNDLHEMTLDINVTTYLNKVRINIIEMTPEEKTIGYDLYEPEKLEDLVKASEIILKKIHKRISREFREYEFLF